jgi:isoleucyl-tRNA synthetase
MDAYTAFDYPAVSQAINVLATVDLSAFYFDVSKDRLYTFGAQSHGRRSAQTAMFLIADGLVRLLAPLLPFTADELWRALPGPRAASVHLADFPADIERLEDAALGSEWQRLMAVREQVNGSIEVVRQQKVIGTSLEASVHLRARDDLFTLLERHRDDLPMLFIVSRVSLERAPSDGPELNVAVTRVDGTRCVRCWRYVATIASDEVYGGLCERCVEAVREPAGAGSR